MPLDHTVRHAMADRAREGALAGVARWTGRSAMSLATDSALPTLVVAGTRRTRVSALRLSRAGMRGPARRGAMAARQGGG
ncbi:MAG TPA: hypothetical protein VEA99_06075 [Gemmatimonadaceae bacterium]|nr:hypothetical protein [Gemmatimonadaceae bacterium]